MRQMKGEPIIVNVYDLMNNSFLYPIGLGAYHTGVEIFGREYTFSESGVFHTSPRDVEAPFRTSIEMGVFKGSMNDFEKALIDVKLQFQPGTYNLYSKNCNSFSNALCMRLLNKPIPAWINRMAGYGNMFSGMMGGDNPGQAPVQQQGTSQSYNSYSSSQNSHQSFTQGTGRKLNESSNNQSSNSNTSNNTNDMNNVNNEQQNHRSLTREEIRKLNAEKMRQKREAMKNQGN